MDSLLSVSHLLVTRNNLQNLAKLQFVYLQNGDQCANLTGGFDEIINIMLLMRCLIHSSCSRMTPILRVSNVHTLHYSTSSSHSFKFLSSLQSIPSTAPYIWNVKVINIWFHTTPMPSGLQLFLLLIFFQVMFTAQLQMDQKSLNVWPSVKGQPNQLPSCIYFTLFKPSCGFLDNTSHHVPTAHSSKVDEVPCVFFLGSHTAFWCSDTSCFCYCLI